MKIKKQLFQNFFKTNMNNYFFYGTLRSISILEKVIGGKTDHLKIIPAFAPKSELRLVVNENFPVIIFGENYSGVEGIVVKGLREEDIARIRFFEDVEFSPKTMIIDIGEFKKRSIIFHKKELIPL